MPGSSEDKPAGFKVRDRRTLSSDGSPREGDDALPPADPSPPRAASSQPAAATATPASSSQEASRDESRGAPGATAGASPRDRVFPPLDFGTFVLSLGSSALLHLGDLSPGDGEGGNGHEGGDEGQDAAGDGDTASGAQAHQDLPMAKHTIDILAMLQDKTKGNLTQQEQQMLEGLLYDLRLRYVAASKTARS
jgi:hypothetical protein